MYFKAYNTLSIWQTLPSIPSQHATSSSSHGLKLNPEEILKGLFISYVYWILIFGRDAALFFSPYATLPSLGIREEEKFNKS